MDSLNWIVLYFKMIYFLKVKHQVVWYVFLQCEAFLYQVPIENTQLEFLVFKYFDFQLSFLQYFHEINHCIDCFKDQLWILYLHYIPIIFNLILPYLKLVCFINLSHLHSFGISQDSLHSLLNCDGLVKAFKT